jgi:effector-binding domain-containing protein
MSELEVRIVQLEPMRVASAHGFGTGPEEEAAAKILAFMAARGLEFEQVRWFGFNNPDPSPGSPNYGYEVWVTVGPEVAGEGEVTIKEVPERLYAVTRFEGLEKIGRVWQELVSWFEDSPYSKSPHRSHCLEAHCLENLLTHPRTPYDQYVFDLYLPIAE